MDVKTVTYLHRDDRPPDAPRFRTVAGLAVAGDQPLFQALCAVATLGALVSIIFAAEPFSLWLLSASTILLSCLLLLPLGFKLGQWWRRRRARQLQLPEAVWHSWQRVCGQTVVPAEVEFRTLQAAGRLYVTALTKVEQVRLLGQISEAFRDRLALQQGELKAAEAAAREAGAIGLDVVRGALLREIRGD